LNLERLRVLHAVGATGSITGAARALHVTTSAVSQQLARLEREVDQQLLERRGRGVRLTEAGALLAGEAGELLTHVERVEAGLARRRGAVGGELAVAAFATAVRGLLPGVLRELRTRHPELVLSVSELEPYEAIPALRRGHLDVAVVQDWAQALLTVPGDLSRQHLLDDRFDVALPAAHPLAGRAAVTLAELAGDDWITWSSGQLCHDWLTSALSIRPRVAHTASEHSSQLALVAAGLGVAAIPQLGRDPVPPAVRLVALDPPPVRHVAALWRTSATARPAIGATLRALRGGRGSDTFVRQTSVVDDGASCGRG
jgi:DNA-binding transcriptional LysR family regulator